MGLNFNSAFDFYRIRTNNVWTLDIPAIAINCLISADDLNGVYRIDYPNPKGFAKAKFTHFQKQEIHITDPQTSSLIHVFTGQINNLDETAEKNILRIDGRGLSGLLTDRKVNDSWTDKRVDFIVADPTFGILPQAFGTAVTTWNAFTDSFTMAAATSSCVLNGFEAQMATSAPPAFNTRIKLAVSAVTCKQAETLCPFKGLSFSNLFSIEARTGIV
jgi:hypothetical protein